MGVVSVGGRRDDDDSWLALAPRSHCARVHTDAPMIALIGDAHSDIAMLRDVVDRIPPEVRTIIQVGDLWVWPDKDDVPPHVD